MALAGYATTLHITGDSTAFAQTVLTEVTEGFVYQMPSAAQRILNPAVAVTVEVDADGGGAGAYSAAAADAYVVDYLNGTVTFAVQLAAAATVRMTGAYLATLPVAEARSVSFDRTRAELDVTVFQASPDKLYLAGFKECTGEFESLQLGTEDLDAGASVVTLEALADAGTPKLLQVVLGASTFRAWVILLGLTRESKPDDLITSKVKFKAVRIQPVGQTEQVSFGMY